MTEPGPGGAGVRTPTVSVFVTPVAPTLYCNVAPSEATPANWRTVLRPRFAKVPPATNQLSLDDSKFTFEVSPGTPPAPAPAAPEAPAALARPPAPPAFPPVATDPPV